MIRFSIAAFAAIFATLTPLAAAADESATPSGPATPSAMVLTQSAEATAALPATGGFGPDGLPRVLSAEDVQRYQKIFALQRSGKWKAADREIAKLTNRRLMGHVLYQRLMHPKAYRAKYKELKDWMAKYADHPDARRVYRLALKRRPRNYKRPNRPEATSGTLLSPIRRAGTDEYMSPRKRSRATGRKVRAIQREVRRNIYRTRLTATEKLLAKKRTRRLLDKVELDEAYAKLAAAWFYYGKAGKAFDLVDPAARRSGVHIPIAHWTAGLAAWRLRKFDAAAAHFESLATSDRVSAWNKASGAYWAARAHLRLRQPDEMSHWLALAADYPRTFYGQLARRALGLESNLDFTPPRFTRAMVESLVQQPAGARALALIQVGRLDMAQRELLRIRAWDNQDTAEALLAVAEKAGLAALSLKLARRLDHMGKGTWNGTALDVALYPLPPWEPRKGFRVDRALVYALMRQESAFKTRAKSPDGARGLMQLMPRTASFIGRDRSLHRRSGRDRLYDPGLNMELGQKYVAHLLDNPRVRGDLFRLTAAYNGGPGNLGRWQRRMQYDNDPLLFIESLPSRETRLFIERVLTNLWIYRERLGQPAPSLDALAAGDWPSYKALDGKTSGVAQNGENR